MENLINKNNDRKVKESYTMVQNEHLNCTYFPSKSANFFGAVVLMLLTKFIPNSTIRRCSPGINFLNYDTKYVLNSTIKKCSSGIIFLIMMLNLSQTAPKKVYFQLLYNTLQKIGANKVSDI